MELRGPDLLREWKAGKFRPVYLFVGEEASAKREALSALKGLFKADDFNFFEFTGDAESEAPSAVSEALTLPVFSDKRLVIVSPVKMGAGARTIYREYLDSPSPTTTLVLVVDDKKPDMKDALTHAVKKAGAVGVFSPLTEHEAEARLKAVAKEGGKELADDAAGMLVDEAGTDWGVLGQEIEKLVLYTAERKAITREDVLATLGYKKAADPWGLPFLVQERKLKDAIGHLRRFLADGKPDEQIFKALNQIRGAIDKQLRVRVLVGQGVPEFEIQKSQRLWYADRDLPRRVKRFSERRLMDDLSKCLRTEADLKSKTWLDPKIELERLVVDLCTP
jgi:DNA polymerase-3 subunit delta